MVSRFAAIAKAKSGRLPCLITMAFRRWHLFKSDVGQRLPRGQGHGLAFSRRDRPELCENKTLKARGAGKTGYRLIPMAPVREECTGQEPQAQPDDPAFPARCLAAYSALSPGTGVLAPVTRNDANPSLRPWRQHRDARTTQLDRPHRDRSSASTRKAAISCGHRSPPHVS
jgi:hypothetical protein